MLTAETRILDHRRFRQERLVLAAPFSEPGVSGTGHSHLFFYPGIEALPTTLPCDPILSRLSHFPITIYGNKFPKRAQFDCFT